MVFRNLPIDFDEQGRAVLREPHDSAYATEGRSLVGDWPEVIPHEEVEDAEEGSRFIKTFAIRSVVESDRMDVVPKRPRPAV